MNESNLFELISKTVASLPERSRDVIMRRFGLGDRAAETLEDVGRSYSITRERVRQIENAGLRALQKQIDQGGLNTYLSSLENHLHQHGGVMEEDHLVESFYIKGLGKKVDSGQAKGCVLLLLSVGAPFRYRRGNELYWPHWYLKEEDLLVLDKVVKYMREHFEAHEGALRIEHLIGVLSAAHDQLTQEKISAHVGVSRYLGRNPFGDFGLAHWASVRPKGVKDKAYLVLKNYGKPAHFKEVAKLINNKFFNRRALPQTVHNELIKDKRFVLVGRGIYGLKEWGYEPGTVKDILINIIKRNGAPVSKPELIKEVLKRRLVKENTIVLNLHNRQEFKKLKDGRYTLRIGK